jgi:hypothetical protein
MNASFSIVVGILPMIVGGIFPFVQIVRGHSTRRTFFLGWAAIVASFLAFTFIIPLVLFQFDHALGRRFITWFPEPPIVVGMIFFGWFYSGVFVGLGLLVRWISDKIVGNHEPDKTKA